MSVGLGCQILDDLRDMAPTTASADRTTSSRAFSGTRVPTRRLSTPPPEAGERLYARMPEVALPAADWPGRISAKG